MKPAQNKSEQRRQLLRGKERGGGRSDERKAKKKKKQEADSRVARQSERKLYLDAVTSLFANLSRNRSPPESSRLFCCRGTSVMKCIYHPQSDKLSVVAGDNC